VWTLRNRLHGKHETGGEKMTAIIDALVSSAALVSHLTDSCKCEATRQRIADLQGKLDAAYDQAYAWNEIIKEIDCG
jgi:hypothetical protein